jgi:hypothetical protein
MTEQVIGMDRQHRTQRPLVRRARRVIAPKPVQRRADVVGGQAEVPPALAVQTIEQAGLPPAVRRPLQQRDRGIGGGPRPCLSHVVQLAPDLRRRLAWLVGGQAPVARRHELQVEGAVPRLRPVRDERV